MSFITVKEATDIILGNTCDFGVEHMPLENAVSRVLAESIVADRDLPPYDRVTMDGIAISYRAFEKGIRAFSIRAMMAAGDVPIDIEQEDECIELMTGCALPSSTDTIIRYEDIAIIEGIATVSIHTIKLGANIHRRGSDKLAGQLLVAAGTLVDATVINVAASVGQSVLAVKRLPRVVIIVTGDELVSVHEQPNPYQVRRSNSYAMQAVLRQHGIEADTLHITDDAAIIRSRITECLKSYDTIILSGGVSMGKFDFVPQALEESGVAKLFHKVRQRPGKPFWFGRHGATGALVFAFPGNPVSAFLCLHRYFIPWLLLSTGSHLQGNVAAALADDKTFEPALQYFLQVSVSIENGHLVAVPAEGNGSGDLSNLLRANAFMELPAEVINFKKGDSYRIWPFKQII